MFNSNNKDTEISDYLEILDKVLEVEKNKKRISPIKVTICIVVGIGSIMFIALLCYLVLKSNFTLESILSTLLAFFSIFISTFFYFKADEASTKFYNSSYEFMKDISVTLGKIEERFGEKLNSLNDKVSHLDKISTVASEEIEDKKDDRYSIINDLMDKANLSEEERNHYREELEKKDTEIERLKLHKYRAEQEAIRLRKRIWGVHDEQKSILIPSRNMLEYLLRTHDTSRLSMEGLHDLQRLGLIDSDGEIDETAVINMLKDNY